MSSQILVRFTFGSLRLRLILEWIPQSDYRFSIIFALALGLSNEHVLSNDQGEAKLPLDTVLDLVF